ncbi:MAG TPA: archease [bacterium]|nr:archease [bacterium]
MTEGARYETFAHAADVGVRGVGPDPASAFEQAALALTSAITDPTIVAARTRVAIACSAPDLEILLFDWLNAVIAEMSARKVLFGRFSVRIEGNTLRGEALGERVDVERHQPAAEPKGATLTSLSVRRTESGEWIAECVVDV